MKALLVSLLSFIAGLGTTALYFKREKTGIRSEVGVEKTSNTTGSFAGAGFKLTTKLDPEHVLAKAKSIKGRHTKRLFLANFWEERAQQEGQAAADWVDANLNGVERVDALLAIAKGWALSDPAKAAQWFLTYTSGSEMETTLPGILTTWGEMDPKSAMAWAKHGLTNSKLPEAMESIATGCSLHDPLEAVQTGMEMLNHDYGDEFVMAAVEGWANQNPLDASKWAELLKPGDAIRTIAIEAVGSAWGVYDPRTGADWVLSLDGIEQEMSLGALVKGWSQHDPGAALIWTLDNFPESDSSQLVIEDVMHAWGKLSPNQAAKWLNNNSSHREIDQLIPHFTSSITLQDPVAAIAWTRQISDRSQQRNQLERILDSWISFGGQSAVDWIQTSDLPEELKQQFHQIHR